MKRMLMSMLALLLCLGLHAQTDKYVFTDVTVVPTSPVKNQARSSTCWSFSGIAQLESELLRINPDNPVILSDMWIVRHTYMDKAEKFLRLYGQSFVGPGGNTHDIYNVIKHHGIVPEEVYGGLNYGTDTHVHSELQNAVAAYMGAIAKNPNRTISPAWKDGLNGILDAYLGKAPETFTYKGKQYTPQSFAASLGLNWDDYVAVTSFTHHPFYTQFALEIPDNWLWGLSYNVTMDDMEKMIDYSLENGYSVTWASDVSETGFKYRLGFAIVPATTVEEISGSDMAHWTGLTADDLKKEITGPMPERTVTQEERQTAFNNQQTTDDHGMQFVGIAKDQFGNKFYKVKNSWGTANSAYDGYFYVSPTFVKYKTTNLMVNKNGIPKDLRDKMGIQ